MDFELWLVFLVSCVLFLFVCVWVSIHTFCGGAYVYRVFICVYVFVLVSKC